MDSGPFIIELLTLQHRYLDAAYAEMAGRVVEPFPAPQASRLAELKKRLRLRVLKNPLRTR